MTDELDIAISKYYVEANALITATAEIGDRWGQLAQQDIHIRERFRLKLRATVIQSEATGTIEHASHS